MLKLIVTISEFGAAVHIGGDVERKSYSIEIPTRLIPERVREHFENEEVSKWQTISLSILDEGAE